MKFRLSEQDLAFKASFETCELPVSEFDHRGHLRLAYVYLVEAISVENGSDETSSGCGSVDLAIGSMRGSLTRYLDHNGVDPSKYHETLTAAWVMAVRHFMSKTVSAESAEAFIDQNPQMLDTRIMMTHYTEQQLFSDKARREFVLPDLDPIPTYAH